MLSCVVRVLGREGVSFYESDPHMVSARGCREEITVLEINKGRVKSTCVRNKLKTMGIVSKLDVPQVLVNTARKLKTSLLQNWHFCLLHLACNFLC